MAENTNSVPLGVANTGAAYVLGPSRAVQTYNAAQEQARYYQKLAEQEEAAAQQRQQAAADKAYKDLAISPTGGTLFNSEINGLVQQHLRKEAQLRAAGINPMQPNPLDPNERKLADDFINERSEIMQMQDLRKNLDTQAKSYSDLISKSNDYDPESIGKFNRFLQQTPENNRLQTIFYTGEQIPTLDKVYDFNTEFDPKINPTTIKRGFTKGNKAFDIEQANRPAIEQQVRTGFQEPKVANEIQKRFQIDPRNMLGTTDLGKIKSYVSDFLQGPDMADFVYQKTGSTSYDSPEFKALVDETSRKQLRDEAKYNQVVKERVDKIAAKAKTSDEWKYDFALNREARAQEAQGRATTNFALKNQKLLEASKVTPQYDQIINFPSYGSQGTKQGQARALATFDVGKVDGDIVPQVVWDANTGKSEKPTGVIKMDTGIGALLPTLYYTDKKTGKQYRMPLNQDQVTRINRGQLRLPNGARPSSGDIRNSYYVIGTQKIPFTITDSNGNPQDRTTTKDVYIPMEAFVDRKLGKNINFDEIEKGLDIQDYKKIVRPSGKFTPYAPDVKDNSNEEELKEEGFD